MEGSRIIDSDIQPIVPLKFTNFTFSKALEFGQKGTIQFSGKVIGERIDEITGRTYKTVRITKIRNTENNRIL